MGWMFFDMRYMLLAVLPGIVLGGIAAWRVKSAFRRYAQIPARCGLSGAEVARQLLRRHGVTDVTVEPHEGFLSDHYDPRDRVVRLSPNVYGGRSLAALGVAAHECGHVLQDAAGYAPMRLRQSLVGPAQFGSTMAVYIVFGGLLLHMTGLAWLGVIAFGAAVLFQLVTLPVEINASTRARLKLVETGIITNDEEVHVGKMLNAAAMTYVAALVTSVITLLYFVMRVAGASRDD